MPPALFGGVAATDCAADIAGRGDINAVWAVNAASRTDRHSANVAGGRRGVDKLICPAWAGNSRGCAVNAEPGGSGRRQPVIYDALGFCAVNLLQVADTASGPTGLAGLDKVRDGNSEQNSDDQHDNHDFNECKSTARGRGWE